MNAAAATETVKVYFIQPLESISVVMSVLIKLNFEVYSVPLDDAYRLVPILKAHPRNVVYFCVSSDTDAAQWLAYIDMLASYTPTQIQFGIFISATIAKAATLAFLNHGVATIDLARLQSNTLETLRKILLYFEAREKRKFVRARAFGICQVLFKLKNLQDAVKTDLEEISIRAFSVKVQSDDKVFFNSGQYIQDVTILLRGKRLRLSARFMGFDRQSPDKGIFLIYFPNIESGKVEYHQQLPKEVRHAIYDYIQVALREDIKRQLEKMEEERPAAETLELI
jgi:hypothetical protein